MKDICCDSCNKNVDERQLILRDVYHKRIHMWVCSHCDGYFTDKELLQIINDKPIECY